MGRLLTPREVLPMIPQQEPFRFVDEITELSAERVTGVYRWRPEADFYRGHFPGNPVTPGVLLVECMAQCTIVPLAIYYFHATTRPSGEFRPCHDATIDFSGLVRPGDRVRTEAQLLFYRRRKVRVRAEMKREDGTLVCSGELAGMGVTP